jgi:UDP-N-acetylmuramoyl-tripeptide--D-alanyl-D-alanine ligase
MKSLQRMHRLPDVSGRGLTLGDIIAWGKGVSGLPASAFGRQAGTIWNDSRNVRTGDVFVAIKTEKDDGHRYVKAAFEAGAAAAIVSGKSRAARVECGARDRKKLITVADPLRAVQRVATRYRRELGLLLIAVTGSSGKTTTRNFIASVLKTALPVGETYTNWNNHIGVPLSILRFTGGELAGVIEMGANHTGEIGVLSRVAEPDVGVITNIGYAHIGLFGSLENTARAKFEIVEGLNRNNGFLLLNGDDERLVAHARTIKTPAVYFGLSADCDVRAENVRFDLRRGLEFSVDGSEFRLHVAGRHFIDSALPAIFLGRRCGIPDGKIAKALSAQRPLAMRGTVEKRKGVTFIVDCYNANPSSMKNAVAMLADLAGRGSRAAIVGDMLELGKYSKRLHREVGGMLADGGVKKMVAVGRFARDIADGAVRAGMGRNDIATAANAEEAVPLTKSILEPGEVVLLKGSRGVHLETVLEKF